METTADTLIDITDEAISCGVCMHVQVTPRVLDDVLSWDDDADNRKGLPGGHVPQAQERMRALLHSVRIGCGATGRGLQPNMARSTTVQHYRIPPHGAGRRAELVILRIAPSSDQRGVVVSLDGEDAAR